MFEPRDVFDIWFLIHEKGVKLDMRMLRKKLQGSYDAAPFGKRKEAESYVMGNIVSRIKHTVTDKSWNNELGGLIMRPRPERKAVVDSVCDILFQMDDISLKVA